MALQLLFCLRKTSRSKFQLVNLFLLPVVASPPVENMRSTGAEEAGTTRISFAAGAICLHRQCLSSKI